MTFGSSAPLSASGLTPCVHSSRRAAIGSGERPSGPREYFYSSCLGLLLRVPLRSGPAHLEPRSPPRPKSTTSAISGPTSRQAMGTTVHSSD
ncbi:hypothetical protein NDU88_005578 [Pleurodeles waltl]|uniref:Uncharacterized protein n=1 Tax=Pleurodeles waltl TaxID=8319 RepID=A0AAV7UJD3_PLEWA|nr:hypothetical protein NDU88_005578 [Pleurodeles waltl]